MGASKVDIINRLKKDILQMQGFKSLKGNEANPVSLGIIDHAFPQGCFPLAATHEFLTDSPENKAATIGFVSGIISGLMLKDGICIWIGSSLAVFPPALKMFGLKSDKIIFIDTQKEKDKLWIMEEALKCTGLSAVVTEIPAIAFTVSRRLQLAVEQSSVTGFIILDRPRNLNITASVSRWKIKSLSTNFLNDLPGVGFPRWDIQLLKIRNGQPGTWQMEWSPGGLHPISPLIEPISEVETRKVI